MNTYKLTVEPRKVTGRKVKSLRAEDLIPGNVFGKDINSYAVQVNSDEFRKIYKSAGETAIVELSTGKAKKAPVLISNVQLHPVTGDVLHVDFRQVDLTKKVTAMVPVVLFGESPAEKSGIGTVVQQITEMEVEALPMELPEKFEVDISALTEVDSTVYVKDLKFDKGKIKLEADSEEIIAKVEPPQKEEEIAPPPEAAAAEGEEELPQAEVKEEPQEEGAVPEPKEQ
jgi:large subunit ribosomal protein L25